ncbi:restriction endonuclease subunit S [Vagococcus lutrae]|uniref:restriction endonuclease subunit S n=1 Tax=Vagococcus lutrae TaxID=81947 RepID=UPI00288FAACE|nr:restriction endonuclease subunit S [Vagococcus lutrae]MDT2806910.1 restriction endonuclease subunit S [Vagococcus lutrae]
MSHKIKTKPEIRFSGYTDDWEQRKLGDLSKISRGASPRPIQDPKWFDNNSDIGWLRIADVTEQNGRITHLEQKISKLAEEKTRVLLTPHLLLSIAATVGKPVINYVKTGVHDGFLIFYNPQFDQEFMFQWLEMFRPKWQKYGQPGSQVNLNSELVKNQDILLPLLEEQVKISTFFKQLDDTIALHQRQLEALEKTKKSFLQKMFPKKDETKPEIRFAGFTDDWEQRKFEEVFEFPVSNNTLSRSQLNYEHGSIKNIHYGDILIKYGAILDVERDSIPYITNGNLEKYRSQLIKNGDLIFADAAEDNTVGKAIEVSGLATESLVAGLHTIVARSKSEIGTYFLGYYINSAVYHYQLLRLMQGAKVSSISKRSLRETKVCIPTGTEEQQKIGTFFKQLDDTIALHQQQLEALEKTKKSFLQKMFV